MSDWYLQESDEVVSALGTRLQTGLDDAVAVRRLQEVGPNELVDRGGKSPWKILLEQFTGIMTIVLIISAVISIFLGDMAEAIAILAIVVLNTILGFTQEYRAEKAMAALKRMAAPHVRVRRNGHVVEITASELVPGDIVLLDAGSSVPADGRVLEAANLRVQEAVLTGESEPIEKMSGALTGKDLAIGDRRNMVYMGTTVTYGRGQVVITNTGMNTELGHIATMLQTVGEESTPLQRRLEQVGKVLAAAALVIVAVVFVLGLLRGEELKLMFETAVSLAVAAVPEGLQTVVTIALALGAQSMLSRQALIRKLPAVETLGSVTVICSDKTGTLTENRMTVTVLDVAGNKVDMKPRLQNFSPTLRRSDPADIDLRKNVTLSALLAGNALCNDATLEPSADEPDSIISVGDPTEGALVIAAARAGLWKDDLTQQYPRRAELPFDSERKRMTTFHPMVNDQKIFSHLQAADPQAGAAAFIGITKGSVDGLLEICTRVWTGEKIEPLDEHWRERILAANTALAGEGTRVLGTAYRFLDDLPANPRMDIEKDLTFLGLVGMIDPARPEVEEAVHNALTAGIRPIMITGDHPLTAMHIARDLGIAQNNRYITGAELEQMSVEELQNQVLDVQVYARVSPEHKLKIVEALQNLGHVVAMTGDGVNDAPALKKADIGVAMGITGTDVSKEAADMVLLNDNFATIVAAVEEGRRIYDNIRKFVKYALSSNTGEIWVMLVAPFLGMSLPLLPLQILWINLVTDGLPGLAMTMEPAEKNTMQRPPHPPQENIFARGLGVDIIWIGLVLAATSIIPGYLGWKAGSATWQTMIFTIVTLAQMGNALAMRSEYDSLLRIGFRSNWLMLWSVLATILLQMAVIYIPFLQNIFGTVALSINELLICLGWSIVVFIAVEIVKFFRRMNIKPSNA
ncbi:MAG: cation-translocating P-type ATPase [Anaerolineaceae bacterium]